MGNNGIGNFEVATQFYAQCKNGTASTSVAGEVVCFDMTTAVDGYTVIQPTTALLALRAGCWKLSTTEAGKFGDVVIYGYVTNLSVLGHASMAVGTQVVATNGQDYGSYAAAADYSGQTFAFTCEVYTTTTAAAAKKAFIRAMG